MQIAHSKTREQFPLSAKKIWKKTIANTLSLGIVGVVFWAIGAFISSSSESPSAVPLLTVLLFCFIAFIVLVTYFYQRWYYAVYFYDLTSDYIVIKKGPITPHEITIPYERVQDVYVDQDLLDRFFGIYDVHLSTATASSGLAAHIDGVEKEAAHGLRDMLLKTINERISKKRIPNPPQG
jgi:membrane protein YdbS with pleckstrin-like domain